MTNKCAFKNVITDVLAGLICQNGQLMLDSLMYLAKNNTSKTKRRVKLHGLLPEDRKIIGNCLFE